MTAIGREPDLARESPVRQSLTPKRNSANKPRHLLGIGNYPANDRNNPRSLHPIPFSEEGYKPAETRFAEYSLDRRKRERLAIVPDEFVLFRLRSARITEHIAAIRG